MVKTCWVKGCHYRFNDKVKKSLYKIPKVRLTEGEQTKELSEERRRAWLANINRKDSPSVHSHICSDHFVHGKPADLYNQSHPDWAPTLKLVDLTPKKSEKKVTKIQTDLKRYDRAQGRIQAREKHGVAKALLDLYQSEPVTEPEYTAIPIENDLRVDIDVVTSSEVVSAVDSEYQRLMTENLHLKTQFIHLNFLKIHLSIMMKKLDIILVFLVI